MKSGDQVTVNRLIYEGGETAPGEPRRDLLFVPGQTLWVVNAPEPSRLIPAPNNVRVRTTDGDGDEWLPKGVLVVVRSA